jgi:hypothetical protein
MVNPVGILSDTHDHREHIEAAVRVFNGADCSLVIHAGDFVAPFTASVFKRLACPFIGVFGNNDGERKGLISRYAAFGELHDPPHEFIHRERRFALMHEPVYLDRYRGRADIDVVVYGHTHEMVIEPGTPLVINPGETCSWITGKSTVVLLDPETLETKVIELRP